MVPHQHLTSAQDLLNLAYTQAQQMLSLAYQQAQQLLACAHSQRSNPPSLVSKCKAHHRPACSLTPCSQILYSQSKVTCAKLRDELVRKSKLPKALVTKVKTQASRRVKSPERSELYCTMKAQHSEPISESSPIYLSMLKQTLTKLEPLFAHEQEPLLCHFCINSS